LNNSEAMATLYYSTKYNNFVIKTITIIKKIYEPVNKYNNKHISKKNQIVNNIINLQYGLKIKKINKKNDRYELMDDGVWENLPKETKIEGIKLYDKEDNILTKHYDISLLDIIDDE
jgi:hypothetical protein